MRKILYLEDNVEYAERLMNNLKKYDYSFDHIRKPKSLDNIDNINKYDLILSDLYLDDYDTKKLIKKLDKFNIPVVVISSTSNMKDELNVLTHNIDEFITKDSIYETIYRRIEKVISSNDKEELHYELDGKKYYLVDDKNYVTDYGDTIIFLSQKEYLILKYLIQNPDIIVTRDELYDTAFLVDEEDSGSRIIDVYISRIRKKLDLNQIQSIRGSGYRWNT